MTLDEAMQILKESFSQEGRSIPICKKRYALKIVNQHLKAMEFLLNSIKPNVVYRNDRGLDTLHIMPVELSAYANIKPNSVIILKDIIDNYGNIEADD